MSKNGQRVTGILSLGSGVLVLILYIISAFNLKYCSEVVSGASSVKYDSRTVYSMSDLLESSELSDEEQQLFGDASMQKLTCSFTVELNSPQSSLEALPCLFIPNSGTTAMTINGKVFYPTDGREYTLCTLKDYVELKDDNTVFSVAVYSRADRAPSAGNLLYLCSEELAVRLISAGSFQRFFVIGISFMIVFYSLSLFRGKKSEKYLIYLAVYAYTTTARTLWNALPILKSIPLSNLLLLGTVNIPGLPQIVCYYLSYMSIKAVIASLRYMLLREFVPVKFGRYPYIGGIFVLFVLLLPFCFAGHGYLASQLFILFIHTAEFIILVRGCRSRFSTCAVLMTALSITAALRVSDLLYTCGLVTHGMIEASLKLQGITEVFFALAFVIVINLKFAGKYSEADLLTVSLEEANQNLEHKVSLRTEELTARNAELSQAYKQLNDMQLQKNEFMTNIIHNLKTPLFSLYGYADMAMEELEDAPELARKHLEEINKNTNYARQLIENLFLCMRLEDGKVKFQPVPFSAELLLQQLESTGSAQANASGINLKVVHTDEELTLTADMLYLRQALQNILDNAIRHSEHDTEIAIRAERQQDPELGSSVCFTIKDMGEGIAPDELPLIFGRYYSNGKKGASSSGLGLTISKGIVEQNGGRIEVSSSLGIGTEFRVLFPLTVDIP